MVYNWTKGMIYCKKILDSISPDGIRIASLHCHFPKFILAEFNTHRVFSRSARSTRAVPTAKLIQEVRDYPVIPIKWGANKSGMQAGEELTGNDLTEAHLAWEEAARCAATYAEWLFNIGLHKQWAGRVLEPFMYVDVLVTSTNWTNFFSLRDHPAAQPEMQELARCMYDALHNSEPELLCLTDWHLPYITDDEKHNLGLEVCRKLSVARCARISYEPFDGDSSIEAELKRYDLLVGSSPIHASPAEHQATPDSRYSSDVFDPSFMGWRRPDLHGNFTGWKQFRKMLDNENVSKYKELEL